MSDAPSGPGWWLASDGKWYPPESMDGYAPPAPSRVPAWLVPTNVSGWAVAAGYLGLLTFILFTIPGPLALFTGIKGLRQIRGRPGLNGKVRAWVGIVLGGLGTVLLPLVVIVVLAGS